MRTYRLAAAVGTAALLALGALVPSYAAGGPPTLSAPIPDPVTADGSLSVSGTGCDASSPISFYLWDTSGGTPYYLHGSDTLWLADGSGAFTRPIPLENRFSGGAQIGVSVSCTTTYIPAEGSSGTFVSIALPDPQVDLVSPASAGFGSRPTVRVTTSDATGVITLSAPGTVDQTAGSVWGPVDFRLPAYLGLGSHTLTATFNPSVSGAPTVTDTATIVITKAASTTALTRIGTGKIKPGKKVKVRVALASTGPRTGVVVIKDGRTIRKTITVRAADNGRKVVWVKLPKKGLRTLTARYAGNRLTKPSLSPKVFVRVKR